MFQKLSQCQKNCHKNLSFKSILNQEVQLNDDNNEKSLDDLSLEDLVKKVQMYINLYMENKINIHNAFQIDLIACVLQVVKKKKETNFVEISNIFDAISKVYSCRVDDFWTAGNKLVKEFLTETKNLKKEHVTVNEIIIKPNRKRLMLTTAEKLCHKDNQMVPKLQYSSDLENDIIDYAKPSRILINTYSDKSYWPEYNILEEVNGNKNQQVKYEMENLSCLIKTGKICPYYHQFVAERDSRNVNDDDQNKLDNITTHFNQETSKFKKLNNQSADNFGVMDIDISDHNSEFIIHGDFSSVQNNKSSHRQENLDSISQVLSMVNIVNNSDYTFFNPKKILNFKCNNHWKDKFKQMSITSKQKTMSCVAVNDNIDSQTHFKTNDSTEQSKKLVNSQYKVDFYLNIPKKLKELLNESGKHYCNYSSWKPFNGEAKQKKSPIRELEFCKYIKMVPNWYKNKFMELNYKITQNTTFIFTEQDILSEQLFNNIFPIETLENIDDNIMNTDDCFLEENIKNMTEVNDNNISNVGVTKNITQDDDTPEEFKFTNSSRCIDMHKLKKCIMGVIKPDNKITQNITFKNLLQKLPKSLPDNMKENISVAVIFVALLHLTNEHNLHLENNDNEIIISQGLKEM